MRFTLDVTMANSEGGLERLLGRLRQRSFTVCAINADTTNSRMTARITVDSARPVELAVKQMAKLIDIQGVEVIRAEENSAHKYRQPTANYHKEHLPKFDHRHAHEFCASQIGL